MSRFDYDVIVIGSGSGGLTAAKTARGFGKRVAIIEKMNRLGGECTWTGCVPSKALIRSAEIAYHINNVRAYGLKHVVNGAVDTSEVMNHIRRVIHEVYQTHTPDQIEKLGIDVLFGSPKFLDRHHIRLGDKTLAAKKFIIAIGLSPFVPPIEGLDSVSYLTNETIFDLDRLPQSMMILGGGAIGAEIACAFNRLGVRVTIIEMRERILSKEDPELVAMLTGIMRDEGVSILTGMRAAQVSQHNNTITTACVDADGNKHDVQAEQLLIAVGRRPNIGGLDLERAGVQTTKRGIIVDATMRTTAKNIYACGDIVGPYLFSHMAWHQAVIATRNALIPFFKKRIDYRHTIWATFTSPELAAAGLTEEQAREKYGDTITIYRSSYADIDRAHTDRATKGLVKIICDKKGRLVGMHILGARAGDIIHELQVTKVFGKRLADLQSIIHAYPTYAELLWHAAKKAYLDQLEKSIFVRLAKRLFVSKNAQQRHE